MSVERSSPIEIITTKIEEQNVLAFLFDPYVILTAVGSLIIWNQHFCSLTLRVIKASFATKVACGNSVILAVVKILKIHKILKRSVKHQNYTKLYKRICRNVKINFNNFSISIDVISSFKLTWWVSYII